MGQMKLCLENIHSLFLKDDIENCVRTINNAINSFLVSSNYTILKKCCVENVCKEYLRVYNEKFK